MKEATLLLKVGRLCVAGYIHLNPVRSGIVSKIDDYVYSSASNYATGTGIITVELVETSIVNVLNPVSFEKYNSQ